MPTHIPVLLKECVNLLIHNKNGVYVDCTLGEGGHAKGFLTELSNTGKLIGLDDDAVIQQKARQNLADFSNVTFVNSNFNNISQVLQSLNIKQVDGIFADLGLSLFHYKESEKGFSFARNDVLDMTLNSYKPNAYDVVNTFSVTEITQIIKDYGEENSAYRIATFIDYYRTNIKKIETTKELANVIEKAVKSTGLNKGKSIHSATKTFQAIRIFVNRELENLTTLLNNAVNLLKPEGRMVILTYHSLEDRIVKQFINEKKGTLELIIKKPIIALDKELKENHAARSAKLRAFRKKDV